MKKTIVEPCKDINKCNTCIHYNKKLGFCWGYVFHNGWCEYEEEKDEDKQTR